MWLTPGWSVFTSKMSSLILLPNVVYTLVLFCPTTFFQAVTALQGDPICFLVWVFSTRVGTLHVLFTSIFSRPRAVSCTGYMFHNSSRGRVAITYWVPLICPCARCLEIKYLMATKSRISKEANCTLSSAEHSVDYWWTFVE